MIDITRPEEDVVLNDHLLQFKKINNENEKEYQKAFSSLLNYVQVQKEGNYNDAVFFAEQMGHSLEINEFERLRLVYPKIVSDLLKKEIEGAYGYMEFCILEMQRSEQINTISDLFNKAKEAEERVKKLLENKNRINDDSFITQTNGFIRQKIIKCTEEYILSDLRVFAINIENKENEEIINFEIYLRNKIEKLDIPPTNIQNLKIQLQKIINNEKDRRILGLIASRLADVEKRSLKGKEILPGEIEFLESNIEQLKQENLKSNNKNRLDKVKARLAQPA